MFISASDESSGADQFGDFQCTGVVAPEPEWTNFFVPAWQERVLDGPPKIDYLHVTETRSKSWRHEHGITELDAENRLDEAANILGTLGTLYPVKVKIKGALFRKLFAEHKLLVASGGKKRYEPDYYVFVYYVLCVLIRVHVKFPEAEKVDFLVEQKSTITKHIAELYDAMPEALRHIDHAHLIPLLGEFISGTKERIPLQAADFVCWHSQRSDAGTLSPKDLDRWVPIATKPGFAWEVPEEIMTKTAEAYEKKGKEIAEATRIREIRSGNAGTNKGSTQRHENQTRRGQKAKRRKPKK